ncbi:MAG: hypothetical protein U5L96_20055 [Owenweeksia sp.]|nr:hypothetical protein [Owenweeksia sp.]
MEDDVELEEELEIQSTETDETEEVEVIEMEEEVSDEVLSFAVVENKPVFPAVKMFPKRNVPSAFKSKCSYMYAKTLSSPRWLARWAWKERCT